MSNLFKLKVSIRMVRASKQSMWFMFVIMIMCAIPISLAYYFLTETNRETKTEKRKKTKEPGRDSEVYRTFLRSIINSIIRFAAKYENDCSGGNA